MMRLRWIIVINAVGDIQDTVTMVTSMISSIRQASLQAEWSINSALWGLLYWSTASAMLGIPQSQKPSRDKSSLDIMRTVRVTIWELLTRYVTICYTSACFLHLNSRCNPGVQFRVINSSQYLIVSASKLAVPIPAPNVCVLIYWGTPCNDHPGAILGAIPASFGLIFVKYLKERCITVVDFQGFSRCK